ncbi:hypothetical protein PLESTB_001468200 [Pleodorina starrii]|uniref:F-box domain-containing protein n=1 Tax=Pleodorina starrii TaxID=330485 RepID=A0A9W6BW06_9CHLO|nr:hypothetical protein PLESTM_001686500 [Pleodorina starrii]GLC59267.1 hypothetical protein PLESTB_001468200 [Pleodorina starrii]GLC74832.1 hypothetical protein PLESTF_001560800 [Pleodorina starrii]
MPRRSNKKPSDDSDSGSGNDDDDSGTLSAARYQQLRLEWALSTWEHNARGTRELQGLFERAFKKDAVKAVQAAMFSDLQTALHQAERMGRLDRTLDQLIAAAARVLPKQKRNLVIAAQKRAAVQMRRAARRGDTSGGDSSGDEGEEACARDAALDDLPLEVLDAIFAHLGPVELARCGCVSRSWRDLSRGADSVWRALYDLTFQRTASAAAQRNPPSAPRDTATCAYYDFQRAAAARPRALLRWSGRVMGPSGPVWLSSSALRRMAPCRVAAMKFPRVDQVVSWACGRSIGSCSGDSSQGCSSESSEDSDEGAASRMRLWVLPPK